MSADTLVQLLLVRLFDVHHARKALAMAAGSVLLCCCRVKPAAVEMQRLQVSHLQRVIHAEVQHRRHARQATAHMLIATPHGLIV